MAYHFDSYDSSLVIDGFEKGIADSPYAGISNMRNVNINSIPGEASVNFSTISQTLPTTSAGNVLSASTGADTVTVNVTSGGNIQFGNTIVFSGADIIGITNGTKYWVGSVSVAGSQNTVSVWASPALSGSPVDITGAGTGVGTYALTGLMLKPTGKASYNLGGGTVAYFIIDSSGQVFRLNVSGSVWVWTGNTIDPDTDSSNHGLGMVAYNGYLFWFRNHKMDYMKIADFTFVYGWKTLVTAVGVTNSHYAVQSYNDSKVYYCDASGIGNFYQNQASATFDPTDATTYTWNQVILNLPSNDIAQCLAELGSNLLVGGQLNAIYPWDMVVRTAGSAGNLSVQSFYSTPILVSENFIYRMQTVNTNTYILAGTRGRVYYTNGSQAQLFKKVPDHISGTVDPYFTWGDIGVSATTNGGTPISQYGGVWAIDLDSQALRLANELSYGTYAGIASVILPQLITGPTSTPAGAGLYVGWDSGASTFGVDATQSVPYIGSQSTIDSDLIPIGTLNKPRDLTQVEYRLSRPMVSGESIVIKSRTIFNTSDTGYSSTGNLSDSTTGNFSGTKPTNFKQAQWIQYQVVINSTASSPSYVRLREIRIMGLVGPSPQSAQQLSL